MPKDLSEQHVGRGRHEGNIVKKLIAGSFVAVLLLVSACGGGDATPADPAPAGAAQSTKRDALSAMMVKQAASAGIKFDEDCMNEQLAKLPDDDVDKIVAAGIDGDADVSQEATAIADGMVKCVVGSESSIPGLSIPDVSLPDMTIPEINDAMVDAVVQSLEGSGMNVDRDCIAGALKELTSDDLGQMSAATPSPEFIQKFLSCVSES